MNLDDIDRALADFQNGNIDQSGQIKIHDSREKSFLSDLDTALRVNAAGMRHVMDSKTRGIVQGALRVSRSIKGAFGGDTSGIDNLEKRLLRAERQAQEDFKQLKDLSPKAAISGKIAGHITSGIQDVAALGGLAGVPVSGAGRFAQAAALGGIAGGTQVAGEDSSKLAQAAIGAGTGLVLQGGFELAGSAVRSLVGQNAAKSASKSAIRDITPDDVVQSKDLLDASNRTGVNLFPSETFPQAPSLGVREARLAVSGKTRNALRGAVTKRDKQLTSMIDDITDSLAPEGRPALSARIDLDEQKLAQTLLPENIAKDFYSDPVLQKHLPKILNSDLLFEKGIRHLPDNSILKMSKIIEGINDLTGEATGKGAGITAGKRSHLAGKLSKMLKDNSDDYVIYKGLQQRGVIYDKLQKAIDEAPIVAGKEGVHNLEAFYKKMFGTAKARREFLGVLPDDSTKEAAKDLANILNSVRKSSVNKLIKGIEPEAKKDITAVLTRVVDSVKDFFDGRHSEQYARALLEQKWRGPLKEIAKLPTSDMKLGGIMELMSTLRKDPIEGVLQVGDDITQGLGALPGAAGRTIAPQTGGEVSDIFQGQ